jgi:hypothetical protein
MRKIIGCARVSIDGVMQEDTSDGFDLGGWNMKFADAKSGAAIMGMVGTLDKPYDLLLGHKTYNILQAIGPMSRQTTRSVRSSQKRTNTY